MEIFKIIAVVVAMAAAVWVLYTLVKLSDKAKDMPDEAPYKLEATEDVAVSDKPKRVFITPTEVRIAKKLGLPLEQFARELFKINEMEASKPKRKYIKRSGYWTAKRKKAAASKAKKQTSKSK